MSAAKLNVARVGLVLFILLGLFYSLSALFSPREMHQSMTTEPFTPIIQSYLTYIAVASLVLVLAGILALRDPLKNRGLVQIIIAFTVLDFLLGTVYVNLAVNPSAPAMTWISGIVELIIAVLLSVGYPRAQTAS